MIIESITLHDFGIYRGRTTIDLTPLQPEKPIILIGGQNGRGKTTLLDAINVILYGNRANVSNRGKKSWDQYLLGSINKFADGEASIGMTLLIEDEFGVRRYELSRSWAKTGKSLKEYFDVRVDGQIDQVLGEQWPDFIENLLPLEIASLNFFDGEKVEELARPEKSQEVISAALRGLLGIGLLEKLDADLKVYLRRIDADTPEEVENPELTMVQLDHAQMETRSVSLAQEIASQTDALERLQELVRRLETQAASLGSENWEKRTELTNEQTQLQMNRYEIEQSLQNTMAGVAPLHQVKDLLQRALERARQDRDIHLARSLVEILNNRDSLVLAGISPAAKSELAPLFEKDLATRREMADQKTVFKQPESTYLQLESAFLEVQQDLDVSDSIVDLGNIDSSLVDVGRRIETLPADDQIAPVLEELGRQKAKLEAAEKAHSELIEEEAHLNGQKARLVSKRDRLLEAEADKAVKGASAVRAREYARRSIEDVKKLTEVTLSRNIPQIETVILERFNTLIGKSQLISKVTIDTNTWEMSISGGDGQPLPVERLSAGERQLLATSTLWGLATVSGRSMPLVIDSPLGKLDASHREHIVTRYFPNASQQVIILSTDTEVVADLYTMMEPFISREYLLDFQEGMKSTVVTEGFFKGDPNAN